MAKNKTEETTQPSFGPELLGADAAKAGEAIAKAGERAAGLVEAWVAARNAAAVAAVADDERAPGPARKAARRGINILKARGVPLPERTRVVARIAEDSVEGHDAWFVPPDGSGTAVVIIAARWRSGRHGVVNVILRDGVGLLEVRAVDMSRSQLKNSFDDSAKRTGYAPVAVPLDWARSRVAAAKTDNSKSGAILPLGIDSYADRLGPAPEIPPPHPIDAAALELPPRAEAVEASANLHAEPEFASWLPPRQGVEDLLLDIGQKMGAGSAGAEQDQTKIDAIIRTAIDAATDRFFLAPDFRELVARRMKDAAISILARKGRDRAAQVMAVSAATVAAGIITSPPHEIPFLRGLFQKALALLAERSGGQLSIPVVTSAPADASPPAEVDTGATPGEKVTPGGIVLP